jgi:hypothetical protein
LLEPRSVSEPLSWTSSKPWCRFVNFPVNEIEDIDRVA